MAEPTVGETIREMREAIIRIAGRHGATQVRLIGSVARGEARPDSDVDLLVTWSEGTSLLDQAALMLDLERLLGRKVDIASDGWVKPSIRESVYRDAIAKIGERITESIDTFQGDEMLQVWVIHHLQVIGEAANGAVPRTMVGEKQRYTATLGWKPLICLPS